MEKFIKACVGILPEPLQKIYYKYEEKWLYLVFGCLTTVISIVSKLLAFFVIETVTGTEPSWEINTGIAFSWVCAVTFAFFTNKKYVFKNETKTRGEFWKVFFSFYASRGATLFLEWLIFFIFCKKLGMSKTIITFLSQVIIFVGNYVLSKLLVFRKKPDSTEKADT